MSRVNIYLPDELAAEARRAGLNVSSLAQDAIREALGVHETNSWLSGLAQGAARAVSHEQTLEALDAGRDDSFTRHG